MELVFSDITSYFAFLCFKRNLKIGLCPVGKMYAVCVLLRNAITFLYGSKLLFDDLGLKMKLPYLL